MMLQIEGLRKSFGGMHAIRDVSISFDKGSLSAIIGPNGAGKTTLFNLISGYLRADAGRILLDGEDLVGLNSVQVARRGIGRAFQVASIFPTLTVIEAVAAAVQAHRGEAGRMLSRFPSSSALERAEEVLDLIDMSDVASAPSQNLSHGDQKLLDIALALALEPRVLLLDEPTAGMGLEERWRMIEKVHRLWQQQRMTLVFIEHDMDIVFAIAERIRVLSYGMLLADGTADEIRSHPEVIKAYLGTAHIEDAI